jgi:hypothetical protein
MWWATLLGSLVTAIVGLVGITAGARLSARETRRATDRVDELHRAASVLLSQDRENVLAGLACRSRC